MTGIKANKPRKGGGWETFKRDEADTLPVWLKAAGYKTALIGKYENGYGKGKPPRLGGVHYWAAAVDGWLGIGTPDKRLVGASGLGPLVRLHQGSLLRLFDQRERQAHRLRP